MTERRPILIFGGTGLLGRELVRTLASIARIVAPTHEEVDLLSSDAVRAALDRVRPDVIVNASGYTRVDRAESDGDACVLLNADVPAFLARESARIGAVLVHFSTDYVFDGAKRAPYVESDEPRPLSVYGRTKLEGERAVASVDNAHLVLRTSWLYGPGGQNFALTMLRLARERTELAVVDDQVGTPTSSLWLAGEVAHVIDSLIRAPDFRKAADAASGVYHATGTGFATWFDFARAILAADPFPAQQICQVIRPIATDDYPLPARRPSYSVLDSSKIATAFGVRLVPWREQWREVAAVLRLNADPAFARAMEAPRVDQPTG